MIRGDVENSDDYEWAPEAQWVVPDPHAVNVLDMSAVIAAANSTLQSEGIIRGDIQNIMGGLPFTGGANSQSLPTDTATGVSIVTNIAQAILARRKGHYQYAYGKIGQMFLELDQQFLPEDYLIEVMGEERAKRWLTVGKADIPGVWDVEVDVIGKGAQKQEEQASSQALTTMAMQNLALMQQAGVPLDARAFWERLLKSHGVTNTAIYFKIPDAAQTAAANAPPSPPNQQTLLDGLASAGDSAPPGGTNEALAAGPTSPSSPASISPVANMHRALARTGAGRSA
jgi:hypothetical protein